MHFTEEFFMVIDIFYRIMMSSMAFVGLGEMPEVPLDDPP